jgi:hypothetical protein
MKFSPKSTFECVQQSLIHGATTGHVILVGHNLYQIRCQANLPDKAFNDHKFSRACMPISGG